MTARVLVVDDIPANVKFLEARLTAEYFEVLTAASGPQALDICAVQRIDVVLLDVMMPGTDGFEVCRRLKASPKTHHIPVVLVTALDQHSDKVMGLECGADDFLTKPVDDLALVTRVRNLARLKTLNDEMLLRAATLHAVEASESAALAKVLSAGRGRVLVVDDHERSARRLIETLGKTHEVYAEADMQAAVLRLAAEPFDVLIVSLTLASADGLRLCSLVRSDERSRHLPIVMVADPGSEARVLRGLDMGVNDYLVRPIDRHEMMARVGTQIKRKRYTDFLRARIEESVEQAVLDPLTGLHNRRYLTQHLQTLVADAARSGRVLSVLMADIDFFKKVNDTYGHDAGDLVLCEFAQRIKRGTRGSDLSCRMGGEEFVIVMPGTDEGQAFQLGERLRAAIAASPFQVSADRWIRVTASIGLATITSVDETADAILRRADQALYDAKRRGRNVVIPSAA